MLEDLERLYLSVEEKDKYKNQINAETDYSQLAQLGNTLNDILQRQLREALEMANLTLPDYMNILLMGLNQEDPAFPDILEKLKGVVEEYREQLQDAPNRKEVEELVDQAKKEMDAIIANQVD
ncbi:hypothetical protein C5O68_12625, partial [Streptococcus pseudopneumoniae]